RAGPGYKTTGSETVVITSTEDRSIDLSGVELPGLRGRIPSGTVLAPGESLVLSNERIPSPANDDRIHVWVPEERSITPRFPQTG
ncbi:MAG: hypothetical protein ACKOQ1_06305, partial [Actinomycetota bacterium]